MAVHNYHIPVMGLAYTIDTPAKIAAYGISSVISIVDDILIEKMRELYSLKMNIPYKAISMKVEDYRAKRITAYLDLMDQVVKRKFEEVVNGGKAKGLDKYLSLLPDISGIKKKFNEIKQQVTMPELQKWAKEHLLPGSIDVNIMTKLDKANYKGKELLSSAFNDAHAALRGFAKSQLTSSLVLSAGMNPRLYSYLEEFEDFYPSATGELRKKVVLKVSDYRSALIQGKFLAKKGIWVSEYRIESGLNCGGHAFATDGYLMGPILEEFKTKRASLSEDVFPSYRQALVEKGRCCPDEAPHILVTAQGGVGTHEEHDFLIQHYELDSVGWGSPFLLVDEVATIDEETKEVLAKAKEEDLYMSDISPLGVPFNSVRGSSRTLEKWAEARKGNAGSPCPKKFLAFHKGPTDALVCTASRRYQKMKLKELDAEQMSAENRQKRFEKIVAKECLCEGLAVSALTINKMNPGVTGAAVSVCPGPNIAYFSRKLSLQEMNDHIYGRVNVLDKELQRPHMFVKELKLYVQYLKQKVADFTSPLEGKELKSIENFKKNLMEGIHYYQNLFVSLTQPKTQEKALADLVQLEEEVTKI